MNYQREIFNGEGRVIFSERMVEVAPDCYVAEKMLGIVKGQKPTITNEEVTVRNVPIGTSLAPWRRWLNEGEISPVNWTGVASLDRRL